MNFEIPTTEPKITKEFLLSKNSQENYMEHYLGVPVKKGLFPSPNCLRLDNKPTCAFYKNDKGVLLFNDFNGITGDFTKIVMEIFHISYYKALRTIANDFNYIVIKNYNINPPKIKYSNTNFKETSSAKIQIEPKKFSEKELQWWDKFGVSIKTLNKFKVFSCKSVFLNDNYFGSSSPRNPSYGYYGGKSNKKELWRIYYPSKFTYRFLSNWSSRMIQGLKQLPKSGELLVITKSLKDVMCLYEHDIPALAPNSETIVFTKSQMTKLKQRFSRIIIFMDNDLAGIKSLKKWKKQYPELDVIFLKRKYAKDISDLHVISKLEGYRAVNKILDNKNYLDYFYKF